MGPKKDGSRRQKSTRKVTKAKKPVECEKFYHGLLPRDDVCELLVEPGDFLVRITQKAPDAERSLVLSVRAADGPHHVIIGADTEPSYRVHIDNAWSFESVGDLVRFYKKRALPVGRGEARLLRAVPRQDWELSSEQIRLKKKIGEGAFGEVWSGELHLRGRPPLDVAVKRLKGGTLSKTDIAEMCREARTMRAYAHPNIVQFYGIAAEQEPLMLCMEFVPKGALDSYVKKRGKTLSVEQLTQLCHEAALGLAYLHAHNCIHRDVAARNCLVGKKGEAKISDFGLSRQAPQIDIVRGERVPVRWLAPETLVSATCVPASDVFAFGVLMWELFSAGQEPYPNMTNAVVAREVKSGYRMPPPERMPLPLRHLLQRCWLPAPADRPSFERICDELAVVRGLPVDASRRSTTGSAGSSLSSKIKPTLQ